MKGDRKFQSILSSLRLIGREEGFWGYFKGNGTNVMRIVPYVAVQFAAYEEYKKVRFFNLSLFCFNLFVTTVYSVARDI